MSFERTTTFSGLKSSQSKFELNSLIEYLKSQNVTSYLEIGARQGDTFVAVMESLPVGSVGLAVDLPGGLWGKSNTGPYLEKAIDHLRSKGYIVHMLLGDSTDPEVIQKIKNFGDFQATLIDGDHTLAGVYKDFRNYGQKGIVCFHDIVGEGQKEGVHNNQVEVPKLWNMLINVHKGGLFKEFVDEGSTMGIGVYDRRYKILE